MRDIKNRIENVSSTEQLIKAMDTIASTKLHKARLQLNGVRPMYNGLKEQVEEIGEREDALKHAFYEEREVKNSLYVVMTSNQGYVGSYNSAVLNAALEHMDDGREEKILSIGTKALSYFRKREKNIVRKITDVADSHVYYGSQEIAQWITNQYLTEEVDEVYIVYSKFVNVLTHEPKVEKILPIKSNFTYLGYESDREYEPSISSVIDHLVPLYLHMNIFRAFSEAHTSEQSARMVNMDSAGKNASELIRELTLSYNRQRQGAITQELSEIVGGTNFD